MANTVPVQSMKRRSFLAEAKNVKMSPRKVRLVAEGIKKYSVPQALAMLIALNKRAANPVKKTIESAVANAVNNFQANRDELFIQEIVVGEGITYKRYHFAARGRTRPYKKRTSHIRIVLGTKPTVQKALMPAKADEAKSEEKGREKDGTKS